MSHLFFLLIIILFLAIKIFKKKHSNNEFVAELGIAILVGAVIIYALLTPSGSKTLKYLIVIYGIVIIGIVIDVVISNKKQPKS